MTNALSNGIRCAVVAHAIAVCQAKLLIAEIGSRTLDAPAGHRLLASVDQRDSPILPDIIGELDRLFAWLYRNVRHMKFVIGKIFLDKISLVTAANDEIIDPVTVIELHDVPEDWLPAYFHHRLWPQ